MNRSAIRFWATAFLVAIGWTLATSYLLPYEALGLESGPERARAWLLTLWTSGVMAICFGAAGMLGFSAPIGFREVAEAGSVVQAMEARRLAGRLPGSLYQNFAGWLIVTGVLLIAIYFLVWGIAYA